MCLFLAFLLLAECAEWIWEGVNVSVGNGWGNRSSFEFKWFKNKDQNIWGLKIFSYDENTFSSDPLLRCVWHEKKEAFNLVLSLKTLFKTKRRQKGFGHYRLSILCKNCEIMTVRPRYTRHATCVAAHNKIWQLCTQPRLLLCQRTQIAASDPWLSCGQLPIWKRKMHH